MFTTMKKIYLNPRTEVVAETFCQLICQSSTSTIETPISDEGDTPSDGWGPANAKNRDSYNIWDDGWDE